MSETIWSPLPGSQAYALGCPCDCILYHGTRGPGKTDAQIMRFRRLVGTGYGRFWRGIIFDREYKNLDDVISKTKRWFPQFGDGARFLASGADLKWRWPTGEELLFRVVKRKSDYESYHGHEYPFIGWNELTKHPTSELFDMMMSTNRSSFVPEYHSPDLDNPLPPIPLEVFATTNPHGVGHNWVRRRFQLETVPNGKPIIDETSVFNPRSQQVEVIKTSTVSIFGSYVENPYLDPKYIARLHAVKDPNRRRAWLEGDWSISAGGAFDDVFDEFVHILPRFKVPKTWKVDRSFDWGSARPYATVWWAESDGTEATLPNGKKFCPPRGTLVGCGELYGSPDGLPGNNEGTKEGSVAVAKKIAEMDQSLRALGWINTSVAPGPADNSISSVQDASSESIATKMEKHGVAWTPSDKSPGTRHVGFQLLRDRLSASISQEDAGIYFMNNCKASIMSLPSLPRDEDDEEDVDTDAEDHIYDAIRYRLLAAGKPGLPKINYTY